MKMFLIIYCEAADEDVIAALKEAGDPRIHQDGGGPGGGDGDGTQAGNALLAREEQCPFHGRGR